MSQTKYNYETEQKIWASIHDYEAKRAKRAGRFYLFMFAMLILLAITVATDGKRRTKAQANSPAVTTTATTNKSN